MKTLLALLILGLAATATAAECKGAADCRACRDCSACWHCSPKNPQGASCGVIRNQGGEAARARLKKQGRWPR